MSANLQSGVNYLNANKSLKINKGLFHTTRAIDGI